MPSNARDWRVLAGHDNGALVDEDGYRTEAAGWGQRADDTTEAEFAVADAAPIAIVRPRNFRDAATIGEYFRQGVPVIINLEDLDNDGSRRVIDFVSGLILGRYGDIEKISRRTFLIVPSGGSILTAHDRITEEGFFNQE